MNDLDRVIKQLITTLRYEKDETQRRRLAIIIRELKEAQSHLVDSNYLHPGYY